MIQDNHTSSKEVQQIVGLLGKNSSGIIALPLNPSVDAIAAGTALYLVLTKAGKTVSLVCSTAPASDLAAADKIQNSLSTGGDNLIVSFPYTDGSIDKVDYNIQGTTFNLVIVPRKDFPKIEPKQVQFSYTGGKIEFIFTIDVPNLNSIGALYKEHQNDFQGKNIINIDRHLINNNFGVINYVNKTSSSTTELVLGLIEELKIEIDKDIASNMYTGLVAATNNFTSYSVNADTFEAASKLLRYGAIKKPFIRQGQGGGNPYPQNRISMDIPAPQPVQRPPVQHLEDDIDETPKPVQNSTRIEAVESKPEGTHNEEKTSSDWLKPKIFPGQGLI